MSHLFTTSSIGFCSSPISALAERARELKMPAMALTDHGNLFGAIDFYQTMSKAGVKPCIGCEVYMLTKSSRHVRDVNSEGHLAHLTLLVKNKEGWRNLCKMVTASYLEGFYYKPRIDKELLRECNKGLIALSGCMTGEMPRLITAGKLEEAYKAAEEMAGIFTDNRFFLEMMDNDLPEQPTIRKGLMEIGKKLGLGLVATNDVHYLRREDAEVHDVLLCIQTGKNLTDHKRMRLDTDEFYLKTPDEMKELFADCPEAISNTVAIAERLNLEFDFNTYYFPKFVPPDEKDLAGYLEEQAREGLSKKLAAMDAKKALTDEQRQNYEKRLAIELEVVKSMGFAGYFLIVADFIGYAKSNNLPVGPGRGSAAGSLVAYCLGITNIDPILHDLLFERFLNPERISMPDVDVDFCMRRRGEVIEYVTKKYGNVSQIITFGSMKAKAAIRDVGRVMGVAYSEVDKIAKMIPTTLGMTIEQALEIEPKLKKLAGSDEQIGKLLKIARAIEGFPRHASTHAAGVVMADRPLYEIVPLFKGPNDEVMTQFDMKCVEKVGLIKFDFLGLKTLTVIDDCIKLITARTGNKIDIDEIPIDDELVYKKLSEGDTAGIFQLESSGMTDLVKKLKPTCFADIVALVALFRPGPLGSGMVDDFINRKHGRTPIRYELPQLQEILKETYGVIVYQEQVMRIANELASYSLGEADILRRAMGKKKADEMAKQRQRFLSGAQKNKIQPAKAEKIFDLMAMFAEYGFNKSHSAAYAMVSYQTAYLKFHYPTEFMAAMLTCEKDNTDKIIQYIGDCRSRNINVLPPDVNESQRDFSVVSEGVIRFGLAAVKNVGEAAIEGVVAVRDNDGKFKSFFNFCDRVDLRKINKRVMESLIKCGAFDFAKKARAALLTALDSAMDRSAVKQRDLASGQCGIFDLLGDTPDNSLEPELPDVSEWAERQLLAYEKESLGFYITGHPLVAYEELLESYASHDTATLIEAPDKSEVKLGGMVARLKEINTRKGDRMGFIALEDLKGSAEVVVFSDVYEQSNELLKSDQPIFVIGNADSDGESVKIIAREIIKIDDVPTRLTKSVHFFLHAPEITHNHLLQLKNVISRYPGECPGFIHLVVPDKSETVLSLPRELKLAPSPNLANAVEKLFGHDVTKFIGA